MKQPSVSVSDELKAMCAKCSPGKSKVMEVEVTMDSSGNVTMKPHGAYEEEKPKSKGKRPRPVEEAMKM